MSLCACKCLNVKLESEKVEPNVDISKLELIPEEQRDLFFSEKFLVSTGSFKSTVSQLAVIRQRPLGRWILHSCLACGQNTHAILQDRPNTVLICKSLQTTADQVANLKKSSNFSVVFNLLIPEVTGDVEMKENIDTSNLLGKEQKPWPLQRALGALGKQLTGTLEAQLAAVEEDIRLYRDQKYAEYDAYRERAQRDHKILASILSKAKSTVEGDAWRMDTSVDNGPPSPQPPPLQRRRLSSIKDAKKISNNHFKQTHKSMVPEDDSLDEENIFDMEGGYSRREAGSDQDDYDSDNSGSHDEGIHISRARGGGDCEVARSLPISVPKQLRRPSQRDLDDDEPSQDIAASIKALAKSVHGDVFELPRPRFSTQI